MEDQQQLKPCPFCGGTDISAVEGSTFRWAYLACNTCGGNRGDCRKANSALTADAPENMVELAEDWNRRASPSSSVLESPAIYREAAATLRARPDKGNVEAVAIMLELVADAIDGAARSALAEIDRALGGGNAE